MKLLLLYLLIMNAVSFVLMLADKRKARKNLWRIPEATLIGVAALGGSLGGYLAMRLCRHKTRHPRFFIGLPLLLAVHIALLVWILPKIA